MEVGDGTAIAKEYQLNNLGYSDKPQIESLECSQDKVCSMNDHEFELFCVEQLREVAKKEALKDFQITHNKKVERYDGNYQIDIFLTCSILGGEIKIICECKHYKAKVKREKVEVLYSRIQSLGMNKGIMLSSSGFQSGAIQFAKEHGIELIQVFDYDFSVLAHGAGLEYEPVETDPFLYLEKHWPKYRALHYRPDTNTTEVLYPTEDMVHSLYLEMHIMVQEKYGIKLPLEMRGEL